MDERSLETRRLPVSSHPEEAEVAFSWVAGVARVGRNEINGSNGSGLSVQSMLVRMAKTEILVRMRSFS